MIHTFDLVLKTFSTRGELISTQSFMANQLMTISVP